VQKKAGSEENQGKQPSDSSTDDHNSKDGGSSSPSDLYFLALFFLSYELAVEVKGDNRKGNKTSHPLMQMGRSTLKGLISHAHADSAAFRCCSPLLTRFPPSPHPYAP